MKRPTYELSLSPLTKPKTSNATITLKDNLLEDLAGALTNNTLNDKILIINDTVKIPVNSSILAMRSPYFEKLFFNDMKESRSTEIFLTVKEDVEVLKEFLSFLYTASISIDIENAFPLFTLSKYFLVNSLEAQVRSSMKSKIPQNPLRIWNEARKLNETEIEASCLKYIKENTHKVLKDSNVKDVERATLIDLLKIDSMDIDEIDLFCFVRDWIELHESSKEDISELIELIRFPMILISDLVKIVKPTQLVKSKYISEALEYHTLPDSPLHLNSIKFSPRRKTWNPSQIYLKLPSPSSMKKFDVMSKTVSVFTTANILKGRQLSMFLSKDHLYIIPDNSKSSLMIHLHTLKVFNCEFSALRMCSDGNKTYALLKDEIAVIEKTSATAVRRSYLADLLTLQTPACCVLRQKFYIFSEKSVYEISLDDNLYSSRVNWISPITSAHTFTFDPNTAAAIQISTTKILIFGGNSTSSFIFNTDDRTWKKTKSLVETADFNCGTQPVIVKNCVFAVDGENYVHCYDIECDWWTIFYKFS